MRGSLRQDAVARSHRLSATTRFFEPFQPVGAHVARGSPAWRGLAGNLRQPPAMQIPLLHAYAGAKVVLTGATGFIGRAVWRRLNQLGADVHASARRMASIEAAMSAHKLSATPLPADLDDPGILVAAIARIRPVILINAAGYGVAPGERDPETAHRINTVLPQRLAETVATTRPGSTWRGQAMVHIGSGFEYGSVPGPVLEDTPAHPQNLYAETKLHGTEAVTQIQGKTFAPIVVARVFTVYGPGEHPHRLLPSLLRAAITNTPVDLTAGLQERDFTYVDDVAEGLLRLGATRAAPAVLNLASGRNTSIRRFAEAALKVVHAPPEIANFGAIPSRTDEVLQGAVSVARLVDALGWHPATTITEGIRLTACNFQESGQVLRERIGC